MYTIILGVLSIIIGIFALIGTRELNDMPIMRIECAFFAGVCLYYGCYNLLGV